MRKFSFWDDWLLLSRLSNDIFTLEVQHFLQRESAFEMSTYLKLEMTLTYSSHFTSLHQARGGWGGCGSSKLSEYKHYLSHILMISKSVAMTISGATVCQMDFIRPSPFLIAQKPPRQIHYPGMTWGYTVLLFPLILPLTRNFDLWEKREALRGPTLWHLDDRPDHLKQLSLFH